MRYGNQSVSQSVSRWNTSKQGFGSNNCCFKLIQEYYAMVKLEEGRVVRWFNRPNGRGLGFIKPNDGSGEIFFDIDGLRHGNGSVADGDPVQFKRYCYDYERKKDYAFDVTFIDRDGARRRGNGRSRSRGRGGGGGREHRHDDDYICTGEISRWYKDKNYGFIKQHGGGEDIFTHVSDLVDGDGSVQDRARVTYVIKFDKHRGKDRATQVKPYQTMGSYADVEGGRYWRGGGGGGRGRRGDSRRR